MSKSPIRTNRKTSSFADEKLRPVHASEFKHTALGKNDDNLGETTRTADIYMQISGDG